MKNIVLIGMMGCGKTTIGALLAKNMPRYSYIDIDKEIELSTQKKISEIFLRHGEPFFRMIEAKKVQQICKSSSQIVSTGGGVFEDEMNRQLLLENGYVIYLKASSKEIFNRIKNETHRPLLKKNFSIEKIEDILKKREKNYKKAHKIINTDNKTPDEIVKEIIGELNV